MKGSWLTGQGRAGVGCNECITDFTKVLFRFIGVRSDRASSRFLVAGRYSYAYGTSYNLSFLFSDLNMRSYDESAF